MNFWGPPHSQTVLTPTTHLAAHNYHSTTNRRLGHQHCWWERIYPLQGRWWGNTWCLSHIEKIQSDGWHIKFCGFFVCSGNLHLQGICRGSCSQSWGESGRQTPGGNLLPYPFFLLPLFVVFLKQCRSFTFSGCLSGEWCGPPWGRTPHSCWSFAKLWCDSFYDGATGTYGGTRERHHHYAAEAGRRLLPTGETQQWPCLQPGANPQWTSAATHHLPHPKWQGAWIQHRRW